MKIILSAVVLFSSMAFSATHFSAFTNKNQLYVTILGDCNTASASLVVDPLCRKDRFTRNLAVECGIELIVATSRMFCPEGEVIPKVFTFNLGGEAVALEAQALKIKYQTQTIKLRVNK